MTKGILSGGTWRTTESYLDVINPYTREVVGAMARATSAQAEQAARAAKAYRSTLGGFDRAEILARAAARIEGTAAEWVGSIVGESGLAVKDARKEVERAVANLRVCAEEAKRLTGEAIPTDVTAGAPARLAITLREPIGLVCAITPFNRPLNQVVVKVGPALASGNSVILKPSEKTPLTALRFAETLQECGLPPPMLSVVTGDPEEVGPALVTSEHIDMLTFTGSAATGERLARQVGMIRTVFELGDSGSLIVMDDADLAEAARVGAAGAFSSGGQSCRGVKRLIVHDKVAEDFVGLLQREAERLRVGDPFDPQTDIGVLISEAAALEVERRVDAAVSAGARLVSGGRREGAQYWPTVLDRVDRAATLVKEETFGPCAPVIRVSDWEDAINCANDTPYGLQAGLYTRDLTLALRAARDLRVGAVVVNGGPQFEAPNIPFGGVKKSGLGREGIRFAVLEMTTVKTVVL